MPDQSHTVPDLLPEVLEKQLDAKSYRDFLEESTRREREPYLSLSFPVTELDPLACLEILREAGSFRYYLEKPDREIALGAGGSLIRIEEEGADRFNRVRRRRKGLREEFALYNPSRHTHGGPLLLGGFSFFDRTGQSPWEDFRPAQFAVPRWSVYREGRFCLLTLNLESGGDAGELDRRIRRELKRLAPFFTLDPEQVLRGERCRSDGGSFRLPGESGESEQWMDSVRRATEMIREGAFKKIVLARKITLEKPHGTEATCLLNALRRQYPACYSFLFSPGGEKAFLGSTPERLASFHSSYLLTEALAGSIRRGDTASEDAMYGQELMLSSKNREEHNLVVRDIESRLRPHISRMESDGQPRVKKLSNVQHLYTPITAWLEGRADPVKLIASMHPTSAVGGYPWKASAPWIRKLERFDRGWYAGPLGWLNLDGEGEFVVTIRSALLDGEEISFFAGCGIVRDSDPYTEWEETNLKLQPMLAALNHE